MTNTRIHGLNAKLKLGGVATPLIDVSGDSNDISLDISQEAVDSTGYGSVWDQKVPGHQSWKLQAKIFNGSQTGMVTSITVGNPGVNAGYAHTPNVTITAPAGVGGVQATATAIVVAGSVTQVIVTNPGSGYLTTPTIGFTPTGGDTPSPAATATAAIGQYTEQMWESLLMTYPAYMEFDPLGTTTGKPKWTGQFVTTSWKWTTPLRGASVIEFSAEGDGALAQGTN